MTTFSDAPLSFEVTGRVIPQGSKRQQGRRMVESSPGLAAWRARVTHEAALAMERVEWVTVPHGVAVSVHLAILVAPVGQPRGDIDKLARAMLDAMSRPPIGAGVYHDDSQVRTLHVDMMEGDPAATADVTYVSVYAKV